MSDLAIETIGSGTQPLVLIHGWAMHGGIFAPLVRVLSKDFALHVVDLPGHGHSRDSALPLEPTAVCAALHGRIPPGALWVGWSMGGLFALEAGRDAILAPRALSLLSSTPRFVQAPDWAQGMPVAQFDAFEQALGTNYRATVERFLALEVLGDSHAQTDLRALRHEVFARGAPEPAKLREGLGLLARTDLRDALPAVTLPTLWVAGRRDRVVPPEAQRRAAQLMPQARYLELPHAAHAGFIGHADTIAQVLRELANRRP